MLAFDRAILERDHVQIDVAFDRATARSTDAFGRMHVKSCRISKATVSPYYGREIPKYRELNLTPDRVYMMYRDPDELKKGASTFNNLQLLALHSVVHAKNPKEYITVGTLGSNVSFDGTWLMADQLTIWSEKGIQLVQTEEAKELSCSYGWNPDMTPGFAPDGVAYDGVMRDIVGNHVALVPKGRLGSDVVVADALPLELQEMKRPHLLAHLVTLGILPQALADDPQRLALDAALCSMTAKDMDPGVEEDMEDDPENPGKKRKKMNPGKGTPGVAGGALASDAQIAVAVDAQIKAGGFISKAEAEKLANDAALAAVNSNNALHTARENVKPLVGVVALDSAEAVYEFALKQEGVALDGIHRSAYGAMVQQRIALKTNKPVDPVNAVDAHKVVASLPGLTRFQHG